MSTSLDEKQSRREFLRDSVRYLSLGGLVFTGGTLFARRKESSTEGECINPDVCQSCSVFNNCNLPLALSTRKNQASIVMESEKR